MSETHATSARTTKRVPLYLRFYYVGGATLIIGLLVAAAIYIFSPEDGRADPLDEIARGRVYEYNVERVGGKAAVYALRFNRWLAALWHGRPLAYTVATLAIVIALACCWLAWLISSSEPIDRDRGPES
jgi:hypothetical protein